MSVLHCHEKVEVTAKTVVVLEKHTRSYSRVFPQRPKEVLPNILRRLLDAEEVRKHDGSPLSLSTTVVLSLPTKVGKAG